MSKILKTLPTIRVKHPSIEGEFMVINKSDFDAGGYEAADEEAEPKKKKKKKEDE